MQLSRWLRTACTLLAAGVVSFAVTGRTYADVQVGDLITKDNMDKAGDLIIPRVKWYVERGMPIKVGPYIKVELPRLYREATEKYSGQVQISPDGREMFNYVAFSQYRPQ